MSSFAGHAHFTPLALETLEQRLWNPGLRRYGRLVRECLHPVLLCETVGMGGPFHNVNAL
ncbi:hypothetical protein CO661_13750 [Sinorhizobium fredii]|uniref:Uncharacterized protein n=1 Tax=Rhizobium fredii TaxID=380 RepID=A0A2A6LYT6_RHIFR|nr:hypothetical protein CO661_13750 [Sinorhizobium fredii]